MRPPPGIGANRAGAKVAARARYNGSMQGDLPATTATAAAAEGLAPVGQPVELVPAAPFTNRFRRADAWLKKLPAWVRRLVLTHGFRFGVPFFGAARAHILDVDEHSVVVRVKNRRWVRNHLGGVHAVAMALSVESASGVLVGFNLPDDTVPLLTRMNIRYVHRTHGSLTARAFISPEQARILQGTPRGEMVIPVEVKDDTGTIPILCELEWAWRQIRNKA